MRLSNYIAPPFDERLDDEAPFIESAHASDEEAGAGGILEEPIREVAEQIGAIADSIGRTEGMNPAGQVPIEVEPEDATTAMKSRLRRFIETGKKKKTPTLLLQIWQSDYSIIAFVAVMGSFYLMRDTGYPPVGVLFFLLAMATVDAILSIFVVRLSFHQNKSGFYRTEDYERDWLRYRMMLFMTKSAMLLLVGLSCGTVAIVSSYIMWFFTSTQRLKYFILRWSMDDHYPELQQWSVFMLLREAGIEPKLRNFNLVATLGVIIGFAIVFIFASP